MLLLFNPGWNKSITPWKIVPSFLLYQEISFSFFSRPETGISDHWLEGYAEKRHGILERPPEGAAAGAEGDKEEDK
jgi:hypothetical protein